MSVCQVCYCTAEIGELVATLSSESSDFTLLYEGLSALFQVVRSSADEALARRLSSEAPNSSHAAEGEREGESAAQGLADRASSTQ